MNLIKLKCNNCNAQLDVDLDNLQAYCPYCGQKLLFDLKNMEQILSEKEKTKRQQMKYEHQERQAQMEAKKGKEDAKHSLLAMAIPFVLMIAFFAWSSFTESKDRQNHINNNEIQITISSEDLIEENADDAYTILKNDGFINIRKENNEELILGLFHDEGEIASISINGRTSFSNSAWFPKDAVVIITYYGYDED